MPWIRLSDNYIDDEKIAVLSDGAFRLWHEGIAFARRHQTDGLIPFPNMRAFPSYTRGREKQLASPCREGMAPLWELVAGMGYKIRKYLDWNLSREEEQNERSGAAARMRKFRSRYAVTDAVTPTVTDAFVPDRDMDLSSSLRSSEREPERKPSTDDARFTVFWGSYPRKVGKDAARKAWQKRRPSDELLDAMLVALDWQKRSDAWVRDGGQYVPHPSTWLNEGRWQDEPQERTAVIGKQTSRLMAAVANIHREAQ